MWVAAGWGHPRCVALRSKATGVGGTWSVLGRDTIKDHAYQGVVFYDYSSIVENRHIRALWPIAQAVMARPETALAGRPLAALSVAANYAVGGLAVWGYHAVNLLLHLFSALLVFGILRRTLRGPQLRSRDEREATWISLAISAIWMKAPVSPQR